MVVRDESYVLKLGREEYVRIGRSAVPLNCMRRSEGDKHLERELLEAWQRHLLPAGLHSGFLCGVVWLIVRRKRLALALRAPQIYSVL